MRVLIVNQHVQDVIGGSEIQCDIIASELERHSDQIVYAVCKPRRKSYSTPYRCVALDAPFWLSFWKAVRELRPTVVYWRFNKPALFVSALTARALGAKFVFAVSAFSDTEPWIWTGSRAFGPLPRAGATGGPLATAASSLTWLLRPIRSAWNYCGLLIADAAVSLNADYLAKLPVARKIRIYNSMPEDAEPFEWPRPYAVWVGGIKGKKRPEVFVRLAAELADTGVDFLMVGPIQEDRFDFLRDGDRLPKNFFYLGPKSPREVNGILRSGLLLIHTGSTEGFGNVFIQAWLQGRPTIGLEVDPESLIESEGLGLVSGTPSRLEADVRRLVEDRDLRGQMGARARQIAVERFAGEKNVRELRRFLVEVVGAE